MKPRHSIFAILAFVVASFAAAVSAQTCPTGPPPTIQFTGAGCTPGQCRPNAEITFTLVDSSGAPYALQSCQTGVTWDFGDDTSTTGLTVTHSYAVIRGYAVEAVIAPNIGVWATVTIANGVVSIGPIKRIVHENEGSLIVNVHTTYAPTSESYTVMANPADPRVASASGTVSFAAGESDKSIVVPLVDDHLYEGNGTFDLTFSAPTNGVALRNPDGLLSSGFYQEVALVDDDPPPMLNFAATYYTFSEADGNAILTVQRTGDMHGTVTAMYNVPLSPGYQSGILTFGSNVSSQTITIPIPNDSIWTADRTWVVYLESATGGAIFGDGKTYQPSEIAVVTIHDDDPVPTLSVSDLSVIKGRSGQKTVNLTVTLSAPLQTWCNMPLTLGGTATPHVDYEADTTGGLLFYPGETSHTFPITIIGNTQSESDKTVTLTIGKVHNGYFQNPPIAPLVAKGTGTLTILNDYAAMQGIELTAGSSGPMSITLGNPTAAEGTVALISSRPDVVRVPASFVAQSGQTSLSFDVEALSAGTSIITASFPSSLGGYALTAYVQVDPGVETAPARRRAVHH